MVKRRRAAMDKRERKSCNYTHKREKPGKKRGKEISI